MKKYFFIVAILAGVSTISLDNPLADTPLSISIQKFNAFYRVLDLHYVDTIDHELLLNKAIKATTAALDPYTQYYNAEQTKKRQETWKGIMYAGIGADVKPMEQGLTITYCRKGLGADKSGLLPGDVIVSVNDSSVAGNSFSEVVTKLRGVAGTTVKVGAARQGKLLTVNIVRKQIISKSITYHNIGEDSIGVIRLGQFLMGSGDEFRKIIADFTQKNPKGIIIDLRNNNGGIAEECVKAVSSFLPKGTLVCSLKGKNHGSNYSYHTTLEPIDISIPIVLLINSNTISSGELFAGTLQDHDRAILIGEKTFGKGLVQGTRFLEDGSSLYVTTAKYFIPSGRCIQEKDYNMQQIQDYSSGQEFTTKNGRKVYGAGGILPDIEKRNDIHAEIISSIIKSDLIFDFANEFRYNNQIIASPLLFRPDKPAKDRFLAYLLKNTDKIKTSFDNDLNKLKNNIFVNIEKEIQKLEQKSMEYKQKSIKENKQLLIDELTREIIKKYFYHEGVYQFNLQQDEWILDARSLLIKPQQYHLLLSKR